MIFSKNIVTEAYIGKHKEFSIVEKNMNKLVKEINEYYPKISIDNLNTIKVPISKINDSKYKKNIEASLKKIFDLKDIEIVFIDELNPNACTITSSFNIFEKMKDENGHYKNPKMSIYLMVDVKMVTYYKITSKELIAIILHEIGHNFYNSFLSILGKTGLGLIDMLKSDQLIFNIVKSLSILGLFDIIELKKIFIKGRGDVTKLIEKHIPVLSSMIRTIQEITFNFSSILGLQGLALPKLMTIKNSAIYKMVGFKTLFGYSEERFADTFVTDHGYGAELASSMGKLAAGPKTTGTFIVQSIPVLRVFYDFNITQIRFLNLMLDPHPDNITRSVHSLNRLKKYLKNDSLSPEMKKSIEVQIKEHEDAIDKIIKMNKDGKKIFSWLSNLAIYKIFKGNIDPRELIWAIDSKNN